MKHLIIDATEKSPAVDFNANSGILSISGKSIPENTAKFYQDLLDWIAEYAKSPKSETSLNIYLMYFNTSSAKRILDLIKQMQKLQVENKSNVTVNWTYEENDTDMLEAGEDFKGLVNIPFNIISVVEED